MTMNDHLTTSRRRMLQMLATGAGVGMLPAGALLAQESWPNRVIRISVGAAPGGSADLVMRPMIQQLSTRLGQSIIMEHRAGANQTISTAFVAKAPADGYTLGFVTDGPMSLAPALPAPLPYDARADFVPIAVLQHVSLVLVTHPDNPIRTLADLVARAKANPGKISYGSLGIGSIPHIALEVFALQNGIELLHVPYSGTAPAVAAAVGREVDMTFVSIGVTLPFLPARLRPIAQAGVTRHPRLASVPTFIESGHKDMDVRAWFGLVAPRRTPEPIVTRLRRDIWDIVSSKEFVEKTIMPIASEPSTVPPEKLEEFLRVDQEKYIGWVKRLGTRVKLT